MPRKTQDGEPTKKVVAYLAEKWKADAKELAAQTGVKGAALVEAVQIGCQNGELMYDIANGVYRYRPITDKPLDLERLIRGGQKIRHCSYGDEGKEDRFEEPAKDRK